MERALDLAVLLEALEDRPPSEPAGIPTASQLQRLMSDLEVRLFTRQPSMPEELLRAAWYLHAVASSNEALGVFTPIRRQRAFQVSAHVFDLALQQQDWNRGDRLRMAFAAEIGYRRGGLDPNASAVYRLVRAETESNSLFVDTPIQERVETLAVEAGAGLLAFEPRMQATYRQWGSALGQLAQTIRLSSLQGTMFGPAQAVVEGCDHLLQFLRTGARTELDAARLSFGAVVSGVAGLGDVDARWVAAHLLAFCDDADGGSIWTALPPSVPTAVRQAFAVASPSVYVLWPPQLDLLAPVDRPSPVAPEQRRLVMALPTSAGKTLMAQIMVVTHLATQATRVCYVTPLRSLAREIRKALRSRLSFLQRELGRDLPDPVSVANSAWMAVAATSTVTMIDDEEPDVDVMTPERLASLLRKDPADVLASYGLFIFDEAHMIAEPGRGFLLEWVLAFLHWRTQTTHHRIVLLSAALGNSGQVVAWLNGGDQTALYSSEWRGPRRLHAVFSTWFAGGEELRREPVKSKTAPVRIVYQLQGAIRLRTAEGLDNVRLGISGGLGEIAFRIDVNGQSRYERKTPNYRTVAGLATALGHAGALLVVTTTRDDAVRTATAIADLVPETQRAVPLADLVRTRLGDEHPLVLLLTRGVAFHHAGLPTDVLDAIEEALRQNVLQYVACTSTLTEGVNLPVRTVVISETVYEGQPAAVRLGPARMINAMGRAGRAGRESEGWIVNVLPRGENPHEFDWADVGPEALTALSSMATAEALESLAAAEDSLRTDADAIFRFGAQVLDDFVAFVWFVLTSEEALGKVPHDADVVEAIESTLGFAQLAEPDRVRWRAIAERVRDVYANTEPAARRRWARTGTTIASSRALDAIASDIITEIVDRIRPIRADPTESTGDDRLDLSSPELAIELLGAIGTFQRLLHLPECPRRWGFRRRSNGPIDLSITLETQAVLAAWIAGTPIPQMGDLLPMDISMDWRLIQMVDTTTELFEHYLSWTLGTLIDQVNERLEEREIPERLCPALPAFLRYGVDRVVAIELMTSGVGSRVLAKRIAEAAETEEIALGDLRTWLSGMQLQDWRARFDASPSELLDLLQYTRSRRSGLIRTLLETGTVTVPVSLTATTTDDESADDPTGRRVTIVSDADEPPPAVLAVRDLGDGTMLATVRLAAHVDVGDVIAAGILFEATLSGEVLVLRLVL